MSIFKGVATALITPMKDDKVDFDSLEKLIKFQLNNNVDALVVNGTTGEPTTLSRDERVAVAKTAIEIVDKKVPVILGAGSNNTHTSISYSVQNEDLGADGLLIVTPYYNKCTQKGLIEHYKTISDNVNIPIIMYNVPGRTGVNINPETALNIAKTSKNVVAIKEASGNISQITEVARLTKGLLDLYSGDDGIVLPILSLGGIGVISVVSNVMPKLMHDLVESFLTGDTAKSRDLQFKVNPFVHAAFCEVNPIPIKCAASLMHLCKNELRLPLTPCSKEDLVKEEMIKLGLIKWGNNETID